MFFDSTFSILLSLNHRNHTFWRQNEMTHSNLILVSTEKIAVQTDVVRSIAEVLLSIFGLWALPVFLAKAFWNFVSMTTRTLLVKIYLLSTLQRTVLEKPQKEGPLKQ